MTLRTPSLLLAAAAIALAACGGSAAQAVHAESTPARPAAADRRGANRDAVASRDTTVADCDAPSVYFDFDSADLSPGTRDTLQRAASCLRAHPDKRVQLVGETDPRGTEEYNLALGDRRARAVRSYLTSLGVADVSLSVTSVGEEYARGSDEASWAQDRKVAPR